MFTIWIVFFLNRNICLLYFMVSISIWNDLNVFDVHNYWFSNIAVQPKPGDWPMLRSVIFLYFDFVWQIHVRTWGDDIAHAASFSYLVRNSATRRFASSTASPWLRAASPRSTLSDPCPLACLLVVPQLGEKHKPLVIKYRFQRKKTAAMETHWIFKTLWKLCMCVCVPHWTLVLLV